MSSLTNINNNSSVLNIGRTTPVSPGQQPANKSIPVVLASDQPSIPVEEQNKIQSEVSLSLLGIPRSEVALGIFADVNTYDVNPSEWSFVPEVHVDGNGIKHLPNEAGALVEAPRNSNSVLTSKRFFRYQPGRVSAATFGIKSSVSIADFSQNPTIRKFGIYDNFDGYYWETRESGEGDNFAVVRRTQSLLPAPLTKFGDNGVQLGGVQSDSTTVIENAQQDDYRMTGVAPNNLSYLGTTRLLRDREILTSAKLETIEAVIASLGDTFFNNAAAALNSIPGVDGYTGEQVKDKTRRDMEFFLDFYLKDLEWNTDAHTLLNETNFIFAYLHEPDTWTKPIYDKLYEYLITNNTLNISNDAETELGNLIDLTRNFFNVADGSNIVFPDVSTIDYGDRDKLDVIFDVKRHYWAGIAAEYDINDSTGQVEAIDYGISDPEYLRDVIYRVERDYVYIIDGLLNDIQGGGNAETKFNASMFYSETARRDSLPFAPLVVYRPELAKNGFDFIRQMILADLTGNNTITSISYADGFGYNSNDTEAEKSDDLMNLIINNFDLENTDSVQTGNRGFAGNHVVLRDKLPMVHAAVYDPSMLKEQKEIKASAFPDQNTFKLTEGVVTFDQRVKITFDSGDFLDESNEVIPNGSIVQVKDIYGKKGNEFSIYDPSVSIDQTFVLENSMINGRTIYFTTVVPFIFPTDYDPAVYQANLTILPEEDRFPRGMMYPYEYDLDQNLAQPADSSSGRVGYVNTVNRTSISYGSTSGISLDIDNINFTPEYLNWVKNNVKPEYYGVYEYRVPRSRFSHDTLDGVRASDATARKRVYSDRATSAEGIVYPGEVYQENGQDVNIDSLYEFDFTKVTMLKIEFSWYGAVGALFLAYVPVENGEARWVRVHHLRASNQLKISSLGNATLPITYNVYGGGEPKTLGVDERTDHGYGNESHNLVKYGASYYIDGGDRGTVRLYSHNNENSKKARGKKWNFGTVTVDENDDNSFTNSAHPSIDNTFFMKARVETPDPRDQGIYVKWVDSGKIYLSAKPISDNITLTTDRANNVYGLETKENILSALEGNSVRNRVQVYPTKMSAANLGTRPVRLRMRKTPIFQTNSGEGTLTLSSNYRVTSEKLPLPYSGDFLQNGEESYGWFQAFIGASNITVFGKVYRQGSSYYFDLLESFSDTVTLFAGDFLSDERFDSEGNILADLSKITQEKEGISSVLVVNDNQVPIPGTGENVTTFYLRTGTEQIDLFPYFDYNKEYLSYPLTNIPETLYLAVDTESDYDQEDLLNIGITWEEQ